MGLLQRALGKFRERNRRVGDIEDEMRAQDRARQKMMSADEREYERFVEEQRQKDIKAELEYFRKKKEAEERRTFMLDKKNIFNNQKTYSITRGIYLHERQRKKIKQGCFI